jgi:RNA polymerase sigma-70 factor (ECF subfamily)
MQDLRDGPDSARLNSPSSWSDWQARAEEANLIAKCQDGDLDAFETIYRRHSPSLYSLTCRMVGDRAEAEDLLQEIFLQAHNKLSSFEGRAAFGTWLYRLAVNRCLDHLRSAARQRQSVTKSLDESPELVVAQETTGHRLDLESAILQLPSSYRSAFLLYDVEGLGHREVADILGVAEGTSKSLVHKARFKLRELLGASQQEKSHE